MNYRACISSVVVLACLSAPACGAPPNLSGPNPGNTGREPNAADLIREVRASEDWLHRIDSLQFRVEGTWSHSPESIAIRRAELKKQDPNREPDPRYDAGLRPSATDRLEYAIDFRKQRLRYVDNWPTEDHFLHIWNDNQLVCYSRRSDGYEQYSLGLSKEPIDRIFGSLSWPRARPHSFWWAPQNVEQLMSVFGEPEDFGMAGRTEYRGMSCYVLEFDQQDGERVQTIQWYVGCSDHLLYGIVGRFGEHWTIDYREIAPGCRLPMTQGYTVKYLHPDTKEPYVRLQRDARLVEVRINEGLPDTLFQMEWKEGVYVMDRRSGETVVSKYVAIPPSLLGQPLPDIASLGIDLAAEQVAGKRLVLCFVDLNQRPSRHGINQLGTHYESLRSHGVVLLAVDVSEMDRESLARWKREQQVPFPLGKIDQDLRRVRQPWGIRSLPWLVLADEKRVVRAEGFSIGELEGRIKQMRSE